MVKDVVKSHLPGDKYRAVSIPILTSHFHTNTSSYAQTPLLGVFPSWWLRELILTGHERLGQHHTARQERTLNPEFIPIPSPRGSLTVTENTADSHPPEEFRLESRMESMASEADRTQSHIIKRVNTSSVVPGTVLFGVYWWKPYLQMERFCHGVKCK